MIKPSNMRNILEKPLHMKFVLLPFNIGLLSKIGSFNLDYENNHSMGYG
jgi:hypothetical protein